MKSDISSRKDIKYIAITFYEKLLKDKKMLPFFVDIVEENQLEHHLEIITDFWNDILFDTLSYKNNVLQKHLNIDKFTQFKKEHFTIWISYFFETIDANFFGSNCNKMKNRASSIATVMQLKMNLYK